MDLPAWIFLLYFSTNHLAALKRGHFIVSLIFVRNFSLLAGGFFPEKGDTVKCPLLLT